MTDLGSVVSDSGVSAGSQVAPTNATNIVGVIPDANLDGLYKLGITVNLGGTAEPLLTNLQIRINGVLKYVIPSLPGSAYFEIPRVRIPAGQTVDIRPVANAAAGSIYTILMSATKLLGG